MPDQDALWNVAAWMAQAACVTLLAELLIRIAAVRSAGFRYAYWRAALAGALLMPWLFRGAPAPVQTAAAGVPLSLAVPAEIFNVRDVDAALMDDSGAWLAMLLSVLAAGTVARLLWLAAGIYRLRAFRRRGITLLDPAYEEMQRMLGTNAELRAVPDLPQPATFGVRRPVVLLPAGLAWAPDSTRRAVVAHELVHVRHRDWGWVLAEELLLAALWFNPAAWWLVSRVQLTREEFTDHIAVLATGSRRAYIEALLAFADAERVEPAPAFARRPHLFHRLVLLSKEAVMSPRRVVLSAALLGAVLIAGGWYASDLFPVAAAPQAAAAQAAAGPARAGGAQAPNTATPENPIPRRRFAAPGRYPLELAGSNLVGAVEAQVVLDASGGVASVTRAGVAISYAGQGSPAGIAQEQMRTATDAFVAAATEAIGQWQYDPPAQAPLAFWVAMVFRPGADAVATQSDSSRGVSAGGGAVAIGRFGGRGAAAPGSTGTLGGRVGAGGSSVQPSGEPLRAPSGANPVRVGGAIAAPIRTRQVAPVYPPIAQSARVQGVVIVEALIDETGRVADVRILRSIPLLDQAAIDAVRQWEYAPVLLNGVPVPVIMTSTVQFTLPAQTQQ